MLLKKCLLAGHRMGTAKDRQQGRLAWSWWGNGAFGPSYVVEGSRGVPPPFASTSWAAHQSGSIPKALLVQSTCQMGP